MSLLTVKNLSVYDRDNCLMAPVSFDIAKGERLTILGESGGGKSLIVKAIMGNLPETLNQRGEVLLFGKSLTNPQRRQLWGRKISALPQEPWRALDPLMPAARQLAQTFQWVAGEPADAALTRSKQHLASLGLADSGHKRVDQLSGGMAQRVAVACAMAGGAPLLLADEPTKGLDVSKRDQIIQHLLERAQHGALITITHDVDVAQQLGGHVMVIRDGQLVEDGNSETLFTNPQHDYTKELIAADPKTWPDRKTTPAKEPLLSARQLTVKRGERTLFQDFDIDFHVGEVVGVVGDSGCGKSSLGDALLNLLPIQSGRITRHSTVATYRWQKLYQDPTAAVAQSIPLQNLLDDVVRKYRISAEKVRHFQERLSLNTDLLKRPAQAVSGGELQRFCLLRVLLLEPVFLFADEPTSRLDPITAKEVSELLVDTAKESHCTVMLVSHDPYLISKRCDRTINLNEMNRS